MNFMQIKKESPLHAWLEIVRPPDLLTIPGDFLAGMAVTAVLTGVFPAGWRIFPGILSVLCLYVFGVINNDICDETKDHFKHPERPIPSKRISIRDAMIADLTFLICGIFFAFVCGHRPFICAVILVAMIFVYNSTLKRKLETSIVGIGFCRGLGFLMGASLVGWHVGVLPVFLSLAAYFGIVTWIINNVERYQIPDKIVFLPALVLFSGWILTTPFLMLCGELRFKMLGVSVMALFISMILIFNAALQVFNHSVDMRQMHKYIRTLVLAIMPWQACWIILSVGYWKISMSTTAILLMIIFPIISLVLLHKNKEY
ncbi:MAG: UbiA family prenyltransferase [Lentisphaeria bacterium]